MTGLLATTTQCDAIADALYRQGWCITDQLLSTSLCKELKAELFAFDAMDALTRAGIGRGEAHRLSKAIRSDRTRWLDKSTPTQQHYASVMEELRLALNRRLFLGLFEHEAHYAAYPPGGFYKKHLDSLHGSTNRLVSTVLYLNEAWEAKDGGELILYEEASPESECRRQWPELGQMAIFLSEAIAHEVATTYRQRYSIAGWFRCNNSIQGAIDPVR